MTYLISGECPFFFLANLEAFFGLALLGNAGPWLGYLRCIWSLVSSCSSLQCPLMQLPGWLPVLCNFQAQGVLSLVMTS